MHRLLYGIALFPTLAFSQFAESPFSLSLESNTIKPKGADDASVVAAEVRLGLPIMRQPDLLIAASISHERYFYDGAFSFDELLSTKASLFALYDINQDWRFMAISTVSSDHEAGMDIGDAINFSGIYGSWYSGFENLLIGGGVGLSSGVDEEVNVFPILIIDWEFAENFTLTTRPSPGTRFGPGVSLLYEYSDQLAFFFGARYISEEYLLRDDDIYSYSTARAFSTAQYSFTNNFSVNATIGLNFAGKIEFESSELETDLDSSIFGALNVSWNF